MNKENKKTKKRRWKRISNRAFDIALVLGVIIFFAFLGTNLWSFDVHRKWNAKLDLSQIWLSNFETNWSIYKVENDNWVFIEEVVVGTKNDTDLLTSCNYNSTDVLKINGTRYISLPSFQNPHVKYEYDLTMPILNLTLNEFQQLTGFSVNIPSTYYVSDENLWIAIPENQILQQS